MRICVTGAAGFIGSHVCDVLLAQGHEVIGIDNLLTGCRENIQQALSNSSFRFVEQDINDPYEDCLDGKPVDQIYNLACPASPPQYQKDLVGTLRTCTIGVMNGLEIAKKCGARFFQASTSEIYGEPLVHPQDEEYRGNVSTTGPRSCFSDDTEILTNIGWRLFKDLKSDDQVATLKEGKVLEYQKPLEIIKERYDGEMIEFNNFQCDLLVTPNHKMYVKKRDDSGKRSFELLGANESMNWSRATMLKVADYDAKEVEWFYFPKDIDRKNSKTPFVEKIKMDDWLEFFGYYITEGCVSNRKRKRIVKNKEYIGYDYRTLIAQSKNNHDSYNRIRNFLERLPFNFVDSYDHQFCITNKQLANYLSRFGKSYEKYIPRELFNVSKRQLNILFQAMMLGDGNKEGTTYYSNSYKLISDFQELLFKLGYAGNVKAHDQRKKKCVYNIHILNRFNVKYKTPQYPKRRKKYYNGFVYCVNVPNHIVFVRRNGKALFCGNCYDEGKRVSESLCVSYRDQFGVDIRIVRIFNTYGPRMDKNDGRVVSNFIVQALLGQPITLYGDGSQTRSFCYVDDNVQGLVALMNTKEDPGPVNIGNPEEYTIKDIAEKIRTWTGATSEIVYRDLPKDDPSRRRPDITKARKVLGWEPKISFEEGVKKTIEYFKTIV